MRLCAWARQVGPSTYTIVASALYDDVMQVTHIMLRQKPHAAETDAGCFAGAKVVVAQSYARIFFRNCVSTCAQSSLRPCTLAPCIATLG